jgi:hypothetical protein
MSKDDINKRIEKQKAKKKANEKKVKFAPAKDVTKKSLKDRIGMVGSFAMAMASRGINNNRIDKKTKQLRVLSCHGKGELPPCEYLRQSKVNPKESFCGGCGCGDRKQTWLVSDGNEYGKLDYPKVSCPLKMPGFTNYEPSSPDEAKSPITRRHYIEQMDMKDVDSVNVTVNGTPLDTNKK